jgi:hypothetical protein
MPDGQRTGLWVNIRGRGVIIAVSARAPRTRNPVAVPLHAGAADGV